MSIKRQFLTMFIIFKDTFQHFTSYAQHFTSFKLVVQGKTDLLTKKQHFGSETNIYLKHN